jgi:hypothetical protein
MEREGMAQDTRQDETQITRECRESAQNERGKNGKGGIR